MEKNDTIAEAGKRFASIAAGRAFKDDAADEGASAANTDLEAGAKSEKASEASASPSSTDSPQRHKL